MGRLGTEEAEAPYHLGDLLDGGPSHALGVRPTVEEDDRHGVHGGVGRLRGEQDGDNKLEGGAPVECGGGAPIDLVEPSAELP